MKTFFNQYDIVPVKENCIKLCIVQQIQTEDEDAYSDSLLEQMIMFEEYLEMSQFEKEHFYIIGCNQEHRIKGIFLLNIGEYNAVEYDAKKLALFLLLIDASEFYSIHNHPTHELKGSDNDKFMNGLLIAAGKLLDIEYTGGYVVDKKGYVNTSTNEIIWF